MKKRILFRFAFATTAVLGAPLFGSAARADELPAAPAGDIVVIPEEPVGPDIPFPCKTCQRVVLPRPEAHWSFDACHVLPPIEPWELEPVAEAMQVAADQAAADQAAADQAAAEVAADQEAAADVTADPAADQETAATLVSESDEKPWPGWHLFFDDARRGHHATAWGTVTCTAGKIGPGIFLDGWDDALQAPDSARFWTNASFAAAAWVRPASIAGVHTVVERWNAPNQWQLAIVNGHHSFSIAFPDGASGAPVTLTAPAAAGVWTHVAGVFDGGTMSLYLNGVLAARTTALGRLQPSNVPVSIGNNASGHAFHGTLDEVRIYASALTPAQVALLAQKTVNDTDGDGAYDEVDGCRTVADASQSDKDGDGLGDACDPCPLDPQNDRDGDSVCDNGLCEASCQKFLTCMSEGGSLAACNVPCAPGGTACETPAMVAARHAAVSARRSGRLVLVHRGSAMYAKENTLEAFRATLELGADGNEFDPRRTVDGIHVAFHDDLLGLQLMAEGDVSEYTWEELSRLRWRDTDKFGLYTRIPTIVEVLDLHRRYAGLLMIDSKQAGVSAELAVLLDAMDMWDHVLTGDAVIQSNPSYVGLWPQWFYDNHMDCDPNDIAAAVASSVPAFFVDDPRGLLHALGRTLVAPSAEPYRKKLHAPQALVLPPAADLEAVIASAPDWNVVYSSPADVAARHRITARAYAAERAALHGTATPSMLAALDDRALHRSLYPHFNGHGLDGASAALALLRLDPGTVGVNRAYEITFRIDPILIPLDFNPADQYPHSWTDWRPKTLVWTGLHNHPAAADVAQLALDYLALPFTPVTAPPAPLPPDAWAYGPGQHDAAVKVLLAADPTTATAVALLQDPKKVVRGRAILELLGRAGEPWAYAALASDAPFALGWIP